ncbi:MAG: NAD(P)-dependent glycerol-3-phosphate dehydrogenase [Fimbriimonadaceae bacterium]|nr:NAD(P)-dependent glycerol-3-phosphate dehydrogenase [Fimbriimonadaceae bacterium]
MTVLGAGSWGTALAVILARQGREVRLLGRNPDQIEAMIRDRENARYLPGIALPDLIQPGLIGEVEPDGGGLIEALPSGAVSERHAAMEGYPLVCIATKGLAPGAELFSRSLARTLPEARIAFLSGPNLARELVEDIPTAAVVASTCPEAAACLRDAFHSRRFRIYMSDDVVGVEVAGALKNTIALAAGMSDGLGFGDNTKGTLLSRGLGEIARIGLAQGARLETFMGIAGVGDLFATAASRLSRNHRLGVALGQGRVLSEALADLGQVAEGVPTTHAAILMAGRLGVEAPILSAVAGVLDGRTAPHEAVKTLMNRETMTEGLTDVFGQALRS